VFVTRLLASIAAFVTGRSSDARREGGWGVRRAGGAPVCRGAPKSRGVESGERRPSIQALYAAARIIGSGDDLAVSGERVLEVVQTTTRMDAGTMFRLDRTTGTLVLIAHRGIPPEHLDALRVRPVEESALRVALRSRRPLVVPFREASVRGARMREVIEEGGYRTLLALPIPVGGETWGILSLVSREDRQFEPETLQLLEAIAYQVGLAVGRASLFVEERARRAHLAALLEINTKIGALAPTDALLSSIADEAARLLGVDNAGFRLLEGDELVLAGVAGSAAETMPQPRLKMGESLSGRVLEQGRPIRAELASAELQPDVRAAAQSQGHTHFLGVPLRIGGRTIGVLTFRARRPFTDLDQELAEAFAGQAAIALEHARLVHEATRRTREASELAAVAGSLTGTLRVEEVSDRIVGAVSPLFRVRSANIRLLAPDGSLVLVARGDQPSAMSARGNVLPPGHGISGHVVATGQAFWTSDVLADPAVRLPDEVRERVLSSGDHAFLCVPLRAKGRIVGAIVLSDRRGREFSAADAALLQSFADQGALALENARLYEETERRRREAEVMAEVARGLNAALDLDTVLQRVTVAARDLCDADLAIIALREPGGDVMLLRQAVGTRARVLNRPIVERGKGAGGIVIETKRPFRTDDYLTDPRIDQPYVESIRAEGIVAELVVPLLTAGQVEGLLYVDRRTRRPFTDRDESVLMQLADHAAVALTNASLYAAAGERAARLRTLNRLNHLVSSSLDTGNLLTEVARAAGEFMNSPVVVFWLADEASRTLRGAAVSDPDIGAYFMTRTLRYGEEAAGWTAAHRLPLNVPDVFAPDSPVGSRDWIVAHGICSVLALPVMHNDDLLAVVVLTGREPFRLGPDERDLLESFLAQAGVAIRNAGLYAETDRRRREAEVLAEVGASINASLDLATVLGRVTIGARDLCASDIARILLREPGSDAMVTGAHTGQITAALNALRIEPGKGVGGIVLQTGRPFRTSNYVEDPRIDKSYSSLVRDEGVVASMAVPIVIEGRVEGLLHVDNRTPRGFTDQDESILARLADQAAVAIRNARLYRETSEYAERLRALDEVNRLVSSSLNPDEVLRNIVAAAARFFDAPWVSMWVVDEARARVVRSFAIGEEGRADGLPAEFAMGEGGVGWVAEHHEPILWTGGPDPRIPDAIAERLHALGMGFRLVYPIAIGHRVLGVLAANRATAVTMTPETEALLRSLASQAALALDHARLFWETSRRLEETRALLDVAEILNSTLDSRQLLKRAAIRIAQICHVDRCSISRWDGERMTPLMAQFADGRARPDQWQRFSRQEPWAPRHVPAHVRAIETRRPVVIHDTAETDLLPRAPVEWFDVKSCMIVPLVRQDQVIGVLTLDYSVEPRRFADWQVELAMTIAGQLALSLENIRLYAEVEGRLRETQTLLSVAETLSQAGPPEEIMRRVAREVGRATSAEMVGAFFMSERKDALVALAGYHVPPELVSLFRERNMSLATFPFIAEALAMGRPTWSADPLHDPRFDPTWVEGLPPHAVLFAPTLAQGQPMGGLFLVWWKAGRAFPAAEVPLIEGVATQVGLALENAELARQTRAKLRETEALLSVSRALASTLDLDAMLRHFMHEAARTLGADTIFFWMTSPDGEWLEPFSGYHVPPEQLDNLRTMRVSMVKHAFYAEAAERHRAILSVLGDEDPRLPDHIRALPHKSQLFVPIVAKDRVIGALAAVWWREARDLSESELRLVEALASQAGVAVENARLFTENRHQIQELSALYDLSRSVTGELDRAALFEAVHAQLTRVMDVRNMVVLVRDEDANDLEVALRTRDGVRNTDPPLRYPAHGVGLLVPVLTEGRALRTDDYVAECARRGVEPVGQALPFPRWLGVPMRAGEHVLGAIAVRNADRAYTEADERLLANAADLAALALRSARLYEERARAFGQLSAAQDQLVRTEKLRALGEMASGVAHDFNNLLAAILGRAQLLLGRVEEPRLRKWLTVIERSALDGAQTVRRLQEFTRIRRDQPFVAVDLNQMVRDTLEITQSRWGEEPSSRGITIAVHTTLRDLPPVPGDPVELREALTNLILNAVDAMPDGGALSLSTAVVEGHVDLSVSDTGVGMTEVVRQRIFDPFFTTKGAQGTGLGLSITYGILTRHHARVRVESEPGQGTTFRLTFDAAVTVDVPEITARAAEPTGEPLRCLVVDDEEAVGGVLGDILETNGHAVVVLTSGAEAVERFRTEPFDVVFTDLAMPGLSGWQVARTVKSVAPTVPVFLVTGFGVELSVEEQRAHGVDRVLTKPLSIQLILDAVASAASRRGQTG
jgi:GAF domain-containing protein/CheY-like chemotaxis protein